MNDEERAARKKRGEKIIAIPVIGTVAKQVSARKVQRLLGLWVMWHTCGGFDGLVDQKFIPRTTLYQNLGEFQQLFGVHIDDWMPETVAAMKKESPSV